MKKIIDNETKLMAIEEAIQPNSVKKNVAKKYNVHPDTLRKWVKKHMENSHPDTFRKSDESLGVFLTDLAHKPTLEEVDTTTTENDTDDQIVETTVSKKCFYMELVNLSTGKTLYLVSWSRKSSTDKIEKAWMVKRKSTVAKYIKHIEATTVWNGFRAVVRSTV